MAWKNNDDKTIMCEIVPGFDFILEEGQNSSTNLRKVGWNGRPPKIDIRKWLYQDGVERAMKGISLSDEATDELASVLVEQGYGDTSRIYEALKKRDDVDDIDENIYDSNDNDSSFYYDPKELLGEYDTE